MSIEKKQEEYSQNYDLVFKWISNVLTGKTLEVLGVKTGKIVEVTGLEPITLQAKEERVDLLLRDEEEQYYRLEEERNLSLSDLYRFASQHFLVAGQLKMKKVKDIIIASGNITPQRSLQTGSGTYSPEIIDLTKKDGREKLKKMKEEGKVDEVELLFLPMYGKEEDSESFGKELLLYAKQMYQENKIQLEFVGALFIMCNKIVSKEILQDMWREITMLKVFKYVEEIAMEKGLQEGRQEGLREMCSVLLEMKFGEKGMALMPEIQAIKDLSRLKIIKDALKKNMVLDDLKKILELLSDEN
ncbi:MAG: hypothetical protein HUU50_12380 [Candidatus Brocadiae bacterium]|nr:hypothetical protein [Candidatus Brocadiia bacterium]